MRPEKFIINRLFLSPNILGRGLEPSSKKDNLLPSIHCCYCSILTCFEFPARRHTAVTNLYYKRDILPENIKTTICCFNRGDFVSWRIHLESLGSNLRLRKCSSLTLLESVTNFLLCCLFFLLLFFLWLTGCQHGAKPELINTGLFHCSIAVYITEYKDHGGQKMYLNRSTIIL